MRTLLTILLVFICLHSFGDNVEIPTNINSKPDYGNLFVLLIFCISMIVALVILGAWLDTKRSKKPE